MGAGCWVLAGGLVASSLCKYLGMYIPTNYWYVHKYVRTFKWYCTYTQHKKYVRCMFMY